MNWKNILNPFKKYSEKSLLVFGLLFFILTAIISYSSKMQQDSIFHLSFNKNITLFQAFLYCGISNIIAVVVLFILGRLINRKTRLIDIVNTILVSQSLNAVLLFVMKITDFRKQQESILNQVKNDGNLQLNFVESLGFLIFTGITLIGVICSFVLFYNGFKTAVNLKKTQHIVIFTVISFVTIILTQTFLPQLLN